LECKRTEEERGIESSDKQPPENKSEPVLEESGFSQTFVSVEDPANEKIEADRENSRTVNMEMQLHYEWMRLPKHG
jgi:hypothetical protein